MLYLIILYSIILYDVTLFEITLPDITFQYIILDYHILYCITLYYILLHYIIYIYMHFIINSEDETSLYLLSLIDIGGILTKSNSVAPRTLQNAFCANRNVTIAVSLNRNCYEIRFAQKESQRISFRQPETY